MVLLNLDSSRLWSWLSLQPCRELALIAIMTSYGCFCAQIACRELRCTITELLTYADQQLEGWKFPPQWSTKLSNWCTESVFTKWQSKISFGVMLSLIIMGVRQCFKSKNSTQLAGDEGRKCTEWTSMRALSGQKRSLYPSKSPDRLSPAWWACWSYPIRTQWFRVLTLRTG